MTAHSDNRSGDRDPWAAYLPSVAEPWNARRVVHLHRRTGFAASWREIERDLAAGPEASIDLLLKGRIDPDFTRTAAVLADACSRIHELKAWWIYRMLFSPDPLGERLALLWHNHFATSDRKVQSVAAMRRQNDLFRKLARAPFGELLNGALRDPALLVWLDASTNRRGRPNENLARELMELFTLGIGHYTEADVKEAARALTGCTVVERAFRPDPRRHDDGNKTILGRTGRWGQADLVKMLLDHPATAARLAFRICELLMGETGIPPNGIAALADGLRRHDLDVGWGLQTVLRSRAFFAEANIRNRVLGPTEFVVGAVRVLGMLDPPPSTLALAEWTAELGQDLFFPPNVGGWPGGRRWLSPQTVIARTNYAVALVNGKLHRSGTPWNPADLMLPSSPMQPGGSEDAGRLLERCATILFGGSPDPEWSARLLWGVGAGSRNAESARRLMSRALSCPEAQLA